MDDALSNQQTAADIGRKGFGLIEELVSQRFGKDFESFRS